MYLILGFHQGNSLVSLTHVIISTAPQKVSLSAIQVCCLESHEIPVIPGLRTLKWYANDGMFHSNLKMGFNNYS